MSKVTATLGRNFIKTKEFQEAQLMGMDAVSLEIDQNFFYGVKSPILFELEDFKILFTYRLSFLLKATISKSPEASETNLYH